MLWIEFAWQFVVLQKGDSSHMHLLWQKMLMKQMLEKHAKLKSREMKQLGKHTSSFLLVLQISASRNNGKLDRRALPIAIVVGVAALAGLYFYLNNSFQGWTSVISQELWQKNFMWMLEFIEPGNSCNFILLRKRLFNVILFLHSKIDKCKLLTLCSYNENLGIFKINAINCQKKTDGKHGL